VSVQVALADLAAQVQRQIQVWVSLSGEQEANLPLGWEHHFYQLLERRHLKTPLTGSTGCRNREVS
jgi:hypothetical protein